MVQDRPTPPPHRVKPLTEGYDVKGGVNPGTSRIVTRPAAPAPIPAQPAPAQPAGTPATHSTPIVKPGS